MKELNEWMNKLRKVQPKSDDEWTNLEKHSQSLYSHVKAYFYLLRKFLEKEKSYNKYFRSIFLF